MIQDVLDAVDEMKTIPGMEVREVCYGCKYRGKLYNEWEIRNGFHKCLKHDIRIRNDIWCPDYTEKR